MILLRRLQHAQQNFVYAAKTPTTLPSRQNCRKSRKSSL